MTVTIVIGDSSLVFRMPSVEECRAAWKLKDEGLKDDGQAVQFFDAVHAQIAPLLQSVSDSTESLETLRESALLWGWTGVGVWSELYFRDLRKAAGASS